MRHRHYKTERGAARYCAKLNAQLAEHERKMLERGKQSQIDFHYVVCDGFGWAVAVVLLNGKQYLCA